MELLQPLPKLPGSLLVCSDVGEAIEDVFKPSFIDYQIFKNSNLCFLNFWTHIVTNDQIFSQVYGWLSNPASAYISLSTRVEVTIFLLVPPVWANHLQEAQFLFCKSDCAVILLLLQLGACLCKSIDFIFDMLETCDTCRTPPSTVLWVLVWARREILLVLARSSILRQLASN